MYICIHICRTPPSCTPPASRGHSIPLAVLVFPCPAKDGEAYMYVIRLMHSYIAVIHTCIWIRLRSQKHILFVGLNFDMFVGIACFISLYIHVWSISLQVYTCLYMQICTFAAAAASVALGPGSAKTLSSRRVYLCVATGSDSGFALLVGPILALRCYWVLI